MPTRMSKRKEGQQGWRWVHEGAGLQREIPTRPRVYWLVLILLGIGLNLGLTVRASI